MRLLEYFYGKRFGSKMPEPISRRGDGEGACPSREMGCGGQRPKVEASNTYVREKQHCLRVRMGVMNGRV